MQSGPPTPAGFSHDVIGLFIRADTETGRVVLRGELRRSADGWDIELRSPGTGAEAFTAPMEAEGAWFVGWLTALLDHAASSLAR